MVTVDETISDDELIAMILRGSYPVVAKQAARIALKWRYQRDTAITALLPFSEACVAGFSDGEDFDYDYAFGKLGVENFVSAHSVIKEPK